MGLGAIAQCVRLLIGHGQQHFLDVGVVRNKHALQRASGEIQLEQSQRVGGAAVEDEHLPCIGTEGNRQDIAAAEGQREQPAPHCIDIFTRVNLQFKIAIARHG